jgi:hypothetical protein
MNLIKTYYITFHLVVLLFCFLFETISQTNVRLPVHLSADGHLMYAKDSLGNRVPDFSYCGYFSGEKPIPEVPAHIYVPLQTGDATEHIQSAINYIASLPFDNNGFRGAVLLEKGTYELSGRLEIKSSGIVIRGGGSGDEGTILLANGTDRQTLIRITGMDNRKIYHEFTINDSYVPVNSVRLNVGKNHSFHTGDEVLVCRPATSEWISLLGIDSFGGETAWLGWKPGERNINWDRTIVAADAEYVTIDVPITTALDVNFGGGTIVKYDWPGRIEQVGIENLKMQSIFDASNPKDEDHCWMAITVENARNVWIRQVTFEHFAGSAVAIYESASRVTVEDCISLHPVSEIGGQRRHTFFTSGQQILFQRCYAEYGYHDFATGFCAPGPIAFVQCEAYLPYSFSGAIDSWSSGVLFDIVNIDGHALSLKNRGQDGQGAGWCAANSMLWQCSASRIDCYSPPTAVNWAFGTWGQFAGNGFWYESNSHVKPVSLYYAQLADRLGEIVYERAYLLPVEYESTTSPTVDMAAELSSQSLQPYISLKEWILQAAQRTPLDVSATGIRPFNPEAIKKETTALPSEPLQIKNGWMVTGDKVMTGRTAGVQWWRGDIRPHAIVKANPHITRFVPGRTGNGLTDDLTNFSEYMKSNNIIAIDHNYGLWYDRRRDDHERIRRMDGEVWPPFYELPFARSGQGTAWDGLSKYDLTKYNKWYWSRLKQFADLADQNELVLIHQNYFQHNILEAGAHFADFPWRTANNINNTGFPEPPPYAGEKRIFMAEQFYDITHPQRRELHTAYIRQCLNNFTGNTNVIQLISEEYTGPLHFMQFWTDIINDWEKENHLNAITGLSATRDVQDSILSDPVRADVIDVIDIRYWHYRDDGSLYAPLGGQNLAPRQHARLVNPGKTSFESVYRAVLEYTLKYPGKAVIYSNPVSNNENWAVFMAGGSLAPVPQINNSEFYKSAAMMRPEQISSNRQNVQSLSNSEGEYIIFSHSEPVIEIDLSDYKGQYIVTWINPRDGSILLDKQRIKAGTIVKLISPESGDIIIWIHKP